MDVVRCASIYYCQYGVNLPLGGFQVRRTKKGSKYFSFHLKKKRNSTISWEMCSCRQSFKYLGFVPTVLFVVRMNLE
jgi:hypothetical protein